MPVITTPITELFKIKHPIFLAGTVLSNFPILGFADQPWSHQGMNVAAGPELAAAVTNAGGLGVIGGHGYTPNVLRSQVHPRLHLLLFLSTNPS